MGWGLMPNYRRYRTYREALEKRAFTMRYMYACALCYGHHEADTDCPHLQERMDWLEQVRELERRMGAPMFSHATKVGVASGLSEEEVICALDAMNRV